MKVSQSAMNKLVIAVIASMGLTACAGAVPIHLCRFNQAFRNN